MTRRIALIASVLLSACHITLVAGSKNTLTTRHSATEDAFFYVYPGSAQDKELFVLRWHVEQEKDLTGSQYFLSMDWQLQGGASNIDSVRYGKNSVPSAFYGAIGFCADAADGPVVACYPNVTNPAPA